MHETARHFICNALITTNKKCIVITHHTPLPELISQKEKYSRLLQWNCSNQTELLSLKCAKKIIAWIHGNSTPHQQNKVVNGIHFVCNSVGMNVNIQPTHLKTFKLII
jgi:hypothetical protein